MLSLNLLSEKIKKENKLNRIYQLIKYFNIAVVFFVSIIAIIILSSLYVISQYYNNEATRSGLTNSVMQNSSNLAKDSSQFAVISTIQKEFVPWSFLIKELSKNIKDDISLSELLVDRNNKQISITGHAGKRESLLDLKNYMENSQYFHNVIFPLKNILEKENIDFGIKAELDVDKIAENGLAVTN
jgi:hypothetical protein